jgi:hypothetical protein
MNEDEEIKIYNAGVKKGQSHDRPSEQTIKFMENTDKRLEKVETKVSAICENHLPHLKEDIALVQSGINNIQRTLEKIIKDYAQKTEVFDEEGKPKFADKKEFGLVQKLVFFFYGMLSLGTLSVVAYLIKERLGIK